MKNIKQFWDICKSDGAIAGWLCLLASVFMLIASLFIPPHGIIDASVIAGVGELMGFAALFKLPNIIQSIQDGKSITLSHGSTTVTVASRDEDGEEKEAE